MAQKLRCPECDEVFRPEKPAAPGRKVRCPECDAVFPVPDEDEGAAPARRRRAGAGARRGRGGGSMPWIVGGAVAVVAAGVVIAVLLSGGKKDPPVAGGGENPKPGGGTPGDGGGNPIVPPKPGGSGLTREKVDRIQSGMKKEDVAALLGAGGAVAEGEVGRAHEAVSGADGASRFARAKSFGVKSWQEWGGGDDRLFVGYAPTKARGERVAYYIWYHPSPDGVMMRPGGLNQGGDLEDAARRWDEESGILNDPKWKTGDEARRALLGAWKIKTGTAGYEFLAGGTYKWLGTPPYTSTYRFTAPQTLEIDSFDPFAKRKGRTITHRVLVAGDEMYLVREPDSNRPLPIGPYVRQAGGK